MIGSIAVHAILLVVILLASRDHDPIAPVEPAPHVELTRVDVIAPVTRPVTPAIEAPSGGGGSPIVEQAAPPRVRTTTTARMTVASYLGRVTIDGGKGDGTGGDGGTGGGHGGGNGTGFGLGTGAGIEREPLPTIALPPPPPASKARPPILIYPKRTAEAEEGDTFLARVKIDHEGYVVGAKIIRGLAPDLNLSASELIWRFRYLPALDDAGTPISWTLDQQFIVQ